ncbi:MAG TPA: hypothetical protein VGC95_04570, partial [Chitinophagaceae bacterium]
MNGAPFSKRSCIRAGWIPATLCLLIFFPSVHAHAQRDTIVLRDLLWDPSSPAGFGELSIPSANSRIAG